MLPIRKQLRLIPLLSIKRGVKKILTIRNAFVVCNCHSMLLYCFQWSLMLFWSLFNWNSLQRRLDVTVFQVGQKKYLPHSYRNGPTRVTPRENLWSSRSHDIKGSSKNLLPSTPEHTPLLSYSLNMLGCPVYVRFFMASSVSHLILACSAIFFDRF